MKRLNIAFDMDGVLIDLMHCMKHKMMEMYDATIVHTGSFRIKSEPPCTNKEIWGVFGECYKMWKQTPVYPGVKELFALLWKLTEEPIKIVTARPYWAAEDTYRMANWLSDVPVSIDIVQGTENKALYLKNYGIFVEDRRKTAYDLVLDHGKKVFLIDRPAYNAAPGKGDPPGVIRISDIRDLTSWAFAFVK